jgi:hypothetical protein
MPEHGYLHHGKQPGPFLTERVRIKKDSPDRWLAWYEGRWRQVHTHPERTYIACKGEHITIQIQGL